MASPSQAEPAASLPANEPAPEPEPTTTTAVDAEPAGPEAVLRTLESNSAARNYAYPPWRKGLIVLATSWTTLAATFGSTSLFAVVDEIAGDFGGGAAMAAGVSASNAGVMLAMAFSSFVWGPVGTILGRKVAFNGCIVVLFFCTLGAALAPDVRTFVVMRVLSGLSGTYFHVSGQAILAEYFHPVQRGTATGFFLAGTVLGPPLGPLVAGVIVTYKSWRVILWLQAAMCGAGLIMSLLFIPYSRTLDAPTFRESSASQMLAHFNPSHIFKLMLYPNVLFTDLACGLLSWAQYTLLSAPRHLLTTRFHLTSPLAAGLFYLSPAAGFLLGTLAGGRASDRTVRAWIARRGGTRVPQDRLRGIATASFFFAVVPAASLVYGWGLEAEVGGLPLPVAMAFFTAAGLLAAFAGLNTYCAEVMPARRAGVIATKYCVQYCFAAAASGASVPMIDAIGVGATSTVSAVFVLVGGVLTLVTARYGLDMQEWVDERLKRKNADPEKQ